VPPWKNTVLGFEGISLELFAGITHEFSVTHFLVTFNPQTPRNNFFVELFKRTCLLGVGSFV
jgi:hypothetical protein